MNFIWLIVEQTSSQPNFIFLIFLSMKNKYIYFETGNNIKWRFWIFMFNKSGHGFQGLRNSFVSFFFFPKVLFNEGKTVKTSMWTEKTPTTIWRYMKVVGAGPQEGTTWKGMMPPGTWLRNGNYRGQHRECWGDGSLGEKASKGIRGWNTLTMRFIFGVIVQDTLGSVGWGSAGFTTAWNSD